MIFEYESDAAPAKDAAPASRLSSVALPVDTLPSLLNVLRASNVLECSTLNDYSKGLTWCF